MLLTQALVPTAAEGAGVGALRHCRRVETRCTNGSAVDSSMVSGLRMVISPSASNPSEAVSGLCQKRMVAPPLPYTSVPNRSPGTPGTTGTSSSVSSQLPCCSRKRT